MNVMMSVCISVQGVENDGEDNDDDSVCICAGCGG